MQPSAYAPPIEPFAPPAFLAGFDPFAHWPLVAGALALLWIVYSVVATYHWFRYGHSSKVATPVLATYFLGSGAFALYAVSGLL